jgi:hypothetical protein
MYGSGFVIPKSIHQHKLADVKSWDCECLLQLANVFQDIHKLTQDQYPMAYDNSFLQNWQWRWHLVS